MQMEALQPASRASTAGFVVQGASRSGGSSTQAVTKGAPMANHLTPEELSKELGIDRQEVIRICIEESIPIYQGKIDKTLFQAQLEAVKAG